MKEKNERKQDLSRRDFLSRTTTATGATLLASSGVRVHAGGSDTLRVAMIGCGANSRSTRDAIYHLSSAPGVELYAIADMFRDYVDVGLETIRKEVPGRVNVTPERIFIGFDAYKKVLAMNEIDIVLHATPPGFRPTHVAAAIRAGKHVFMEKPGAVCPSGIRTLLAAADEADRKGLSIVVGTQQRYVPHYHELINRIWDGQIGEIRLLKALWLGTTVDWHNNPRQPEWSDMEWQIRCWPYFTWLSGDHLVEQLCHNLDVCNWIMKSAPESCAGVGGRQVRTGDEYGHIYDHFAVDYAYKNGPSLLAMATQIHGVTTNVSNVIEGTKGIAHVTRRGARIEGEKPWKYEGKHTTGDLEMHGALIRSVRERKPINECRRLAETTMTAIVGRMSAYTGKALRYDWALKQSKLNLLPPKLELGPLAVAPIAMPGKTPLV